MQAVGEDGRLLVEAAVAQVVALLVAPRGEQPLAAAPAVVEQRGHVAVLVVDVETQGWKVGLHQGQRCEPRAHGRARRNHPPQIAVGVVLGPHADRPAPGDRDLPGGVAVLVIDHAVAAVVGAAAHLLQREHPPVAVPHVVTGAVPSHLPEPEGPTAAQLPLGGGAVVGDVVFLGVVEIVDGVGGVEERSRAAPLVPVHGRAQKGRALLPIGSARDPGLIRVMGVGPGRLGVALRRETPGEEGQAEKQQAEALRSEAAADQAAPPTHGPRRVPRQRRDYGVFH